MLGALQRVLDNLRPDNIMSSLLDSIGDLIEGRLDELGASIGVDAASAKRAVGAALPTLLAGLQRNADRGEAIQLAAALERDHDGGLLDDLSSFFSRGRSADGESILGHVLGSRRQAVEEGLAKASGLDAGSVGKLLPMLAPVILGALGKQKRERELGVSDLGKLLRGEAREIERRAPESGFLGRLLD